MSNIMTDLKKYLQYPPSENWKEENDNELNYKKNTYIYSYNNFVFLMIYNQLIIMTSAYLAISFLKQTPLLEKQLRIFWSYLPQELLKEYLYNADIYKGRRHMSKSDLIEMIITERSKKVIYTQEDDELTKEEANKLLKNNSFAKKENTVPEIKAKAKPVNN